MDGVKSYPGSFQEGLFAECDDLRWFLLPSDVVTEVNHSQPPITSSPFQPGSLTTCPLVVAKRQEDLATILRFCRQPPKSQVSTDVAHSGGAISTDITSGGAAGVFSLVRYIVKLLSASWSWWVGDFGKPPAITSYTTDHIRAEKEGAKKNNDVERGATAVEENKEEAKVCKIRKPPKVAPGEGLRMTYCIIQKFQKLH
eukprot:sb/3470795/